MPDKIELFIFYYQPFKAGGPSYTCTEILNYLLNGEISGTVYAPRVNGPMDYGFKIVSVIPRKPFPYKPVSYAAARLVEGRLMHDVARSKSSQKVVYLWPGASIGMVRALSEQGVVLVRELINTFDGYGEPIIAKEYRRCGETRAGPSREKLIDGDRIQLSAVDLIFANNKFVEESLRTAQVPEDRVLPSSYGWSPERLSGDTRALETSSRPTFLYVGDVSIHKGVHLLLDYWAQAGIDGRLVLAGGVEPALRRIRARELSRPDIISLGYVADIGAVYRSADAFVFPSLDEGGPQVTYEAAGCGLPLIVSPMGAGRIAVDGENAFVRDPHDVEGWTDALRCLAQDSELRARMGRAAATSAQEFTWAKVGARRRELLLGALSRKSSSR